MNENFIEREFEEVQGGYYENDFYYTPNGSFWDAEGFYFNQDGYDKHGGYYDDYLNYIPGQGWNQEKECYESELENTHGFYEDYDDGEYYDDDGDDIPYDPNYMAYDEDELSEDAYINKNDPSIEKIVFNQSNNMKRELYASKINEKGRDIENKVINNIKSTNDMSNQKNNNEIDNNLKNKPKIKEINLPYLEEDKSKLNSEMEKIEIKKPEEKQKSGLAALLAGETNKTKNVANKKLTTNTKTEKTTQNPVQKENKILENSNLKAECVIRDLNTLKNNEKIQKENSNTNLIILESKNNQEVNVPNSEEKLENSVLNPSNPASEKINVTKKIIIKKDTYQNKQKVIQEGNLITYEKNHEIETQNQNNFKQREEINITKDLESLEINISIQTEQENSKEDEFDRSKYSKHIPINNKNEYYRNSGNINQKKRKPQNLNENQFLKIKKPNQNENIEEFNNQNIDNSGSDSFGIMNKNYNENINNQKNTNNRNNYNYNNRNNNMNMNKDQQLNKFNNFNQNNNNFDNKNPYNKQNKVQNNLNQMGNQNIYADNKFSNNINNQIPYGSQYGHNYNSVNPNLNTKTYINNFNNNFSINYPNPSIGGNVNQNLMMRKQSGEEQNLINQSIFFNQVAAAYNSTINLMNQNTINPNFKNPGNFASQQIYNTQMINNLNYQKSYPNNLNVKQMNQNMKYLNYPQIQSQIIPRSTNQDIDTIKNNIGDN